MSIKINGLRELSIDLKKAGEKGKRILKTELEVSASTIEGEAIRNAPAFLAGQQLNIKQRIDKVITNQGLTAKVGVQGTQDLDAYIEFGTGLDFIQIVSARPNDYTPEIKDLAKTFYKNGQGTLKGTPYLFPAFFSESPKLIERLKQELEKIDR
jgi:hypothetical protein